MSDSELYADPLEALRLFCGPFREARVGNTMTIQLPTRRINVKVIAIEELHHVPHVVQREGEVT